MNNQRNRITIIPLAIACLLLLGNTIRQHLEKEEIQNLLSVAQSELKVWKDKDGNNMAKIEAFESSRTEIFLKLEFQDSLIQELQKEVKSQKSLIKKGGSITIVEGETKFDTVFVANNPKIYNSLFKEPITDSIKNEWVKASFGVELDSINETQFKVKKSRLSLSVKNKYVVTIGKEKGKPIAMVKNLNPYSETTAVRAFQTKGKPPNKLSIRGFVGPGVLISKEVRAGIVAGAGLTYKF